MVCCGADVREILHQNCSTDGKQNGQFSGFSCQLYKTFCTGSDRMNKVLTSTSTLKLFPCFQGSVMNYVQLRHLKNIDKTRESFYELGHNRNLLR